MTDPPALAARSAASWRALAGDRSGAVVLEYALIGGLIAVMAISAVVLFGETVATVWTTVSREMGGALGGS